MTRRLALIAAMALALPAAAQDASYVPIATLPLGSSALNLPTPSVMSRGTWELRITHRFEQPIGDGDSRSFWGVDEGADVALGLTWAAVRDLELSLYRSNIFDDYEVAAKYAVLRQAPAVPASLSVRAGVDVRTERNLDDRVSGFAQAVVSRQFGRRFTLFAVPTAATNAGRFSSAFNVPFGGAWFVKPYLSIVAEIIPPNSDLPSDVDSDLSWSLGVKRAIGGHYFELVLTDSRATHVDHYMSGDFLGGLDAGDVHLGFNIERRFGGR